MLSSPNDLAMQRLLALCLAAGSEGTWLVRHPSLAVMHCPDTTESGYLPIPDPAGDVLLVRFPNTQLPPEGPQVIVLEHAPGSCRVCGCTNEVGCAEGCLWAEPDLCSSCVGASTKAHQAPSRSSWLPVAAQDDDLPDLTLQPKLQVLSLRDLPARHEYICSFCEDEQAMTQATIICDGLVYELTLCPTHAGDVAYQHTKTQLDIALPESHGVCFDRSDLAILRAFLLAGLRDEHSALDALLPNQQDRAHQLCDSLNHQIEGATT